MKIFLICPVRGVTDEEKVATEKYVLDLETAGNKVHWPPRNTDQDDPVGLRICQDNRQAIEDADEVHIWWNDKSQGSLFDFGIAFALKRKSFWRTLIQFSTLHRNSENFCWTKIKTSAINNLRLIGL